MRILDPMKVEKDSPVPIYHQIYLLIKNVIDEEVLKEGDVLISERELQDLFKVSRVTIRKALDNLAKDEYIRRERGSPTIVLGKNKSVLFWSNATGFSRDMKQRGVKVSYHILKAEWVTPPEKVKELFKLEENELVFSLWRIPFFNNIKMGISKSFISPRVQVKLDKSMFNEDTSLFEILRNGGLDISVYDEVIEAKTPTPELREMLGMKSDEAIFHSERITYDSKRTPFESVEFSYNASYYRYYILNGEAEKSRSKRGAI